MGLLKSQVFVCIDCETTGLDVKKDRIIEVAVVSFTLHKILDSFSTLVHSEIPISEESLQVHKINPQMVADAPKIEEVLPKILEIIAQYPIVGHGVGFDIEMIQNAAKRKGLKTTLGSRAVVDTLRLARHYGDAPSNSLKKLAEHFNVPADETHRALADVLINIEVFKHLVKQRFQTLQQLLKLLSHPIKMKVMPLGKHKGRLFHEIPLQYLQWAANMDFDQDLLYSIRLELKRRKKGGRFSESTNPFADLSPNN